LSIDLPRSQLQSESVVRQGSANATRLTTAHPDLKVNQVSQGWMETKANQAFLVKLVLSDFQHQFRSLPTVDAEFAHLVHEVWLVLTVPLDRRESEEAMGILVVLVNLVARVLLDLLDPEAILVPQDRQVSQVKLVGRVLGEPKELLETMETEEKLERKALQEKPVDLGMLDRLGRLAIKEPEGPPDPKEMTLYQEHLGLMVHLERTPSTVLAPEDLLRRTDERSRLGRIDTICALFNAVLLGYLLITSRSFSICSF